LKDKRKNEFKISLLRHVKIKGVIIKSRNNNNNLIACFSSFSLAKNAALAELQHVAVSLNYASKPAFTYRHKLSQSGDCEALPQTEDNLRQNNLTLARECRFACI